MTGIALIPLESPEALRGIRRSTCKKRRVGHLYQSRTSRAPQSPTRDEGSSKRARHSYERQPRHKTREDHYEYKAPSAVGSRPQARKGRAKNGRGRKHTLNDDFQAVNVTGNRLTVSTKLCGLSSLINLTRAKPDSQSSQLGHLQQGEDIFSG